jgi:hypothetical protein
MDREGFLLYAEAAPEDSTDLLGRLQEAGVSRPLALPSSARLGFAVDGKLVSVDGRHELKAEGGVPLLAETRPAAEVIFRDVKPRPYYRWGGLQGQRVRYFPSGQPRFRAPEEVLKAPGQQQPQADVRAPHQPAP